MGAHGAARHSVSAARDVRGKGCPSSLQEAGLNGKQVRIRNPRLATAYL